MRIIPIGPPSVRCKPLGSRFPAVGCMFLFVLVSLVIEPTQLVSKCWIRNMAINWPHPTTNWITGPTRPHPPGYVKPYPPHQPSRPAPPSAQGARSSCSSPRPSISPEWKQNPTREEGPVVEPKGDPWAQYIPSRKLTYPVFKALLKMIFRTSPGGIC